MTYTYDAWARLKTAQTTGSTQFPQWGLSWDGVYPERSRRNRYGNRKAQNVTLGSGPSNAVTPSATTNRITDAGYSYDLAGNMTNDGRNVLVYDAESRVVSSTTNGNTVTYTLDGASLRVKKVSGSTTTVYIFAGSKVIAEYENGAAPSAPTREYVFAGSQLLAKLESGATTYFHRNHLSNRVVSDSGGTIAASPPLPASRFRSPFPLFPHR